MLTRMHFGRRQERGGRKEGRGGDGAGGEEAFIRASERAVAMEGES